MDLRQIYGDLAKQIIQKNNTTELRFEHAVCNLFSCIVQVERFLVTDDEKEIRENLAECTSAVLEVLECWTKSDWCLRSPKFERGRFASGSDLTASLRSTLADMFYYYDRDNETISRDVIITAELLLKRCIELSKKLDFDLAMALFEHLRK